MAPPRTQPWARLWTGLRTWARAPQTPPLPSLAALAVLAAAALLLVPQVVLLGKLPDNPDYWLQEYVHLAFLHRWLRAGELPLWNPQLAAGTPHLADPQSAVLYPLTTVPLLLLGPAATARLALPLHFFLAGAFTYGYTRSLCLSRPAATAAGLAYALAPHFAPLGNATYLQQSAAWVPAILWALHTGFDRARLAPFAVAGLLWALQLARGYPQTWYVTGLLAAAYCLVRGAWLLASRRADASPSPPGPAARRPLTRAPAGPGLKGRRGVVVHGGAGASPSPRGPLRGLPGEQPEGREDGRRHPPTRGTAGPIGTLVCGPVLFAAVGLGAGAAQLLPSLDLLAQSHRSGGYSLAEASGYAAVGLANLLGAPGPAVEVTGAFPGGVVLGLALAALLYGRGRGTWRAWVHAGLAGTALALCLGDRTPLWALAYRLIPGFATLHMPHRMLFLWSLALAVLAGAGVDALRTLRERPRPSGLSALVVASAASAGLAWLALPALPDPDSAASKGVLHLAAGLAAVALTAAGLSWMPHPRLTYAADSSTTAPAGGPPSHVGKGERGVSRIGLLACCLLPLASGPGVGGVGLLLPALVAADLLAHNLPRLHGQFYPPAHVYAPPPAVEWLQARLTAHGRAGDGPFRIASARFRADSGQDASAAAQDNRRLAYLPPNVPALYSGLEAAQGYLAIRSTAAGEVFDAINDLGQRPRILSIYDPRSRLLDLLNVRYFVADDADTFPSVVGGGRSLVATDTTAHPLVAAVREPLPARELEIYSSLGDAVDVEDGAAVAEVVLRTTDGREVGLLVRAGEHTAEWLYDAPRVAGTVRHRKAPIARSTVRADRGSAYQSHVYRARFDVTPLGDAAVQEVRLRVVHPRARWNVDRLILHTPLSARFRLAHAQGPLRIWENPAALPRAWWVGAYAVEPDRAAQLAALKDPAFDFTRHALLAHPIPHLPPQPASSLSDTERRVNGRSPAGRDLGGGEAPCLLPVASCLSGPGPGGEVRTRNATANTRELEAMAPAPGLLLISESFAPGWRAWVDGRPAPVYRAGGNLQAVPVPAGAHTVRLTYLPTSVLAGAALSLATLAILGTWALWAARNRWGRASAASGTAAATG